MCASNDIYYMYSAPRSSHARRTRHTTVRRDVSTSQICNIMSKYMETLDDNRYSTSYRIMNLDRDVTLISRPANAHHRHSSTQKIQTQNLRLFRVLSVFADLTEYAPSQLLVIITNNYSYYSYSYKIMTFL